MYAVHTQLLENYNLEAEVEAQCFWKFKGGTTFIVLTERMQDAVALVQRHLIVEAQKNGFDYFRQFPVSWEKYNEWVNKLNLESEDYRKFELNKAVRLNMDGTIADVKVKAH